MCVCVCAAEASEKVVQVQSENHRENTAIRLVRVTGSLFFSPWQKSCLRGRGGGKWKGRYLPVYPLHSLQSTFFCLAHSFSPAPAAARRFRSRSAEWKIPWRCWSFNFSGRGGCLIFQICGFTVRFGGRGGALLSLAASLALAADWFCGRSSRQAAAASSSTPWK